jgi:hypothetical protein
MRWKREKRDHESVDGGPERSHRQRLGRLERALVPAAAAAALPAVVPAAPIPALTLRPAWAERRVRYLTSSVT